LIDPKPLRSAMENWLGESLPRLTASNSFDVHISDLLSRAMSPQEQLDASVEVFEWVTKNCSERLTGKLTLLMIPLRNCQALEVNPPSWWGLSAQLSATPPSIYVMEISAYLQPQLSQRYIAPFGIPWPQQSEIRANYQCWRNLDDPQEDGWSRDIRAEHVFWQRLK
jgi:hypothetical protein